MLSLLTGSPVKLKLENAHGTLIILFYVRLISRQLQRLFYFQLLNYLAKSLAERKYLMKTLKDWIKKR